MTVEAVAIPARPGQWKVIRLADGTKVKVMVKGDERLHYLADSLGNAYQRVPDTDYYRLMDMENVEARSRALNTANRIRRDARMAKRSKASGGLTGEKKGLIILVEFSDKTFEEGHDKAYYERVANEKDFVHADGFKGSVYDYFYAQSEGLFQMTFDIIGPVKLSKGYAYYGANDSDGWDKRDGQFAYDAIKAAKDSVDFSNYDWDQDGEVDQVFLLYAGPGEANGGDDDTIWPHEWGLSEAYITLTYNDVLIDTYACGCELQPDKYSYKGDEIVVSSWKVDGIGTICHEFSHCLGYPDFYDTNYKSQGMGYWDLMDSGSYNDDGFLPAGFTSYERWVAGWKEPIVLTDSTTVTGMQPLSEGGDSYVIYNDGNEDEYYLLENRQQTHWDGDIPGKGLLILHVDYKASAWEKNEVNDVADHQRMTWIAADNKYGYTEYDGAYYYSYSDMAKDPYPYGGNNSFGNTTTPAATLYNKNSDGTKYLNKRVYDITQHSDRTISFVFGSDEPVVENVIEGDTLFYESFDKCKGKGGNDDVWVSINGQENSNYIADNEGWETIFVRGGDQCAIQGSGTKTGIATTPTINVQDGDYLLFKAAPWGNSSITLDLSLSENTMGCTVSTFNLEPKKWTDCKTQFSGSGDVKVTFVPEIKRFFLDEVQVIRPVSTGIMEIHKTAFSDNSRIYTLDGRYAGTDTSLLSPGLYLMNGKKIVISRRRL